MAELLFGDDTEHKQRSRWESFFTLAAINRLISLLTTIKQEKKIKFLDLYGILKVFEVVF